ncbi:hypothetical protein [Klebsiella spallanzanii]|uniref:hypothetical protein n=1 Tax=Klebsiella spallanzanii TaxID=2587528 RepID=UPI00116EAD11|nr:hypothetical protein [Klebsiella spallanzanii]VUS83333.1 hypothetical protein SB6419_04540 [Klebsiella spallanzanii]
MNSAELAKILEEHKLWATSMRESGSRADLREANLREAEIKRFVDACDELRDATRRPLTEWEAEQDRLKKEEEERISALLYRAVTDTQT